MIVREQIAVPTRSRCHGSSLTSSGAVWHDLEMAFFGYYAVARTGRPIDELTAIRQVLDTGVDGISAGTLEGRWSDGDWQLAVIYQGWELDANDLVAATGAPALVVYVIESAVGVIEAATVDGGSWRACLNPDDAIRAYDFEPDDAGTVAGTTELATGWAAAAGRTPDPEAIAAAVKQYVGPFGDGVSAFLAGLGFHFE